MMSSASSAVCKKFGKVRKRSAGKGRCYAEIELQRLFDHKR